MAAATFPILGLAGVGDDNIFAVTYNICWGCMQNDDKDLTGKQVVTKCKANGHNSCFNNVILVFDSLETIYGRPLDLVGTQESSSRYDALHTQSIALKKMNRVHCLFGVAHHVSFYNPTKFNLDACAGYNIGSAVGQRAGFRPMLILLLTRIVDGRKIAFINIHDGHGVPFNNPTHLQNAILEALQNGKLFPSGTIVPKNLDNIQNAPVMDIRSILNDSYEIIFMGDTNENIAPSKIGKYTKGNYNPFGLSQLPSAPVLMGKSVNSIVLPVSCCQNGPDWPKHSMMGDYILYSKDIIPIHINNEIPTIATQNYNAFPLSDHFPVVSILNLPIAKLKASLSGITSGMKKMGLSRPTYKVKKDTKIYLYNYLNQPIDKDLKQGDLLIIPDSKDIITHKGANLVIIQVLGNSIVGYIQSKYLQDNRDNTLTLNQQQKTLRLLPLGDDPNAPQTPNFTGFTVTNKDVLIYPATKPNSVSEYYCVRKSNDPNIFGFVNENDIELLQQTGGNIRKYKTNKKSNKHSKKYKTKTGNIKKSKHTKSRN